MAPNLTCHHRRGFMFMDAVAGLVLITALATALAMSVGRQNRGEQKLADMRTATRIAEQTLAELRLTGKNSAVDGETRLTIQRAEGGWQAEGQRWVEIRVRYRGQSAQLVGLAPSSALPKEGGRP